MFSERLVLRFDIFEVFTPDMNDICWSIYDFRIIFDRLWIYIMRLIIIITCFKCIEYGRLFFFHLIVVRVTTFNVRVYMVVIWLSAIYIHRPLDFTRLSYYVHRKIILAQQVYNINHIQRRSYRYNIKRN